MQIGIRSYDLVGAGHFTWELAKALEYWPLATGDWPLETGYWRLVTGDWPLATGDWQLGTDFGKIEKCKRMLQ
jgi:hypothetical protein